MKTRGFLIILVSVIIFQSIALAGSLTGEEILSKVEEVTQPATSHVIMRMILADSRGNSRERKVEMFRKNEELSSSIIKFLEPADVKGTGFLALEKENGSDDMYLYLPALGSARRISSSQKNGSFVGTDFTYNDMAIIGGGKFNRDYDSTVIKEGEDSYQLKLIPVNEDIDYKQVNIWIKRDSWYPLKLEFYNQKGELYKLMEVIEVEEKNNYYTIKDLIMKDLERGTSTEMIIEEVEYDLPLDDQIFTVRFLRR